MKKLLKQSLNKKIGLFALGSSFFILGVPLALSSCWLTDWLNGNNNNNNKGNTENHNPIYYNQRYDLTTKQKNPNYKVGELTFVEYPYAKKSDGTYLYFFGSQGLKKMSQKFLEKANFGPEITEIKEVTINKNYDKTIDTNQLNGFYTPHNNEIALFTKHIVANGTRYVDWSYETIDKKVNMVLPTLIHEYTHHIANIYNNSGKKTDLNYYSPNDENGLVYKMKNSLGQIDDRVAENYTNNKKFVDEFREALNYKHHTTYDEKLLANSDLFDNNNVFRTISSWELFEWANIKDTKINPITFSKFANNFDFQNYTWNNRYSPLQFQGRVSLNRVEYLYSFEELIPREFLKMTYNPDVEGISLSGENTLWFYDAWSKPYVSAYGEDIIRNGIRYIVSPNWVFDTQLKMFKNANGEIPFSNLAKYQNLKKLFKAYVDLMGYGLPISYMGNSKTLALDNNVATDLRSTNFGGYLKSSQVDMSNQQYLRIGNKDYKISIFKNNFVAKPEYVNYTISKSNMFNPHSLLGYENYEYSYITEPIQTSTVFQNYFGSKFDVKLWTDKNNNKQFDVGEEVSQFNDVKNYTRLNEIKRSIINLRKYLETNSVSEGLNRSYKLDLTSDDGINYKYKLMKY